MIKKSERNAIFKANSELAEDDPRMMDLFQLLQIGAVTIVTITFWYRGKEYSASEYVDDEALTPEEIMGHFVKPFRDAVQKRDEELGDAD